MRLKDLKESNNNGILHYDGYEINVWEERDRIIITLYDNNEKEIRSWIDDSAREMFDDGFFDWRHLRKSIVDYAHEIGLIK